jgi:phosphopantothenoylcysteine decarboxylase/phosphopantothenate--cysteine ligase
MSEATEIAAAAEHMLRPPKPRPLAGKRVLITAGPTHEPIDPVRYIANRSSGKQGFAIAAAAQAAGADVDAGDRPGRSARSRRRHGDHVGVRARHAAQVEAACRPISRSSPPPSPTGASPMRASRS